MKRLFFWALGGAALVAAGSANATTCSNATFRKLQFFSDDTGAILWQSPRDDSPLDPNKQRLLVHVLSQDGDDFAGAFSNCSGIENRTLGQVRNLSFDFMNTTGQPVHVGAGSPRYSVGIDKDGDGSAEFFAFLAAASCGAVLPEDTTWSRADFTGRVLAGCALFAEAETFTSDGSKSAWTLFAEAHPTWKVTIAFLVVDEAGTTFVDRLAFHNKLYVAAGSGTAAIKNCPSEASC
jgi:hypothetical protein